MSVKPILHVTTRDAWEKAQSIGEYQADSLQKDGYIHCSENSQISQTADMFYNIDPSKLVVLVIDTDKLKAKVKYDYVADLDAKIPHIYGPLNLDAIMEVQPYNKTK